jgi:hypothetical protein
MTLPKVCPVCDIKNEGNWRYLCPKCWCDFCDWAWKQHGYNNDVSTYLPEYMEKIKVKVYFT